MESRLNILCVVKAKKDRACYRSILEEHFLHKVHFTTNASRSITLFRKMLKNNHPIDLVFVEYLLYDMDGISLANRLRTIDSRVLLMLFPTPFLAEEDVRSAYRDFGGFLMEPSTTAAAYTRILDRALRWKSKKERLM